MLVATHGPMSAHFSFEIDRPRGLVRIAMSGFFLAGDIARFIEARRQAHEALGWPPNTHVTLNDISGMKIQSQDAVAAFQEMLTAGDYRSRRLAFVIGLTLARGQVNRALAGRDARCFEDEAEAEAWLLAEDEMETTPLRRAAG